MPNQNTMTETKLYRELMDELTNELNNSGFKKDDFHIIRIESPSTPGIPDINLCVASHEVWIECKVYPNTMENYQIAWKKKRELASGNVFVVTYKRDDYIELDFLNTCLVLSSIFKIVEEILGRILK